MSEDSSCLIGGIHTRAGIVGGIIIGKFQLTPAFIALEQGRAELFPVVTGHGGAADRFFAIKSGVIGDRDLAGLKLGTYWPGNRAAAFAGRVIAALGIEAASAGLEDTARAADILVTATATRAPLVQARWVQPGTHISAMGADPRGKQELDMGRVGGCTLRPGRKR